MENKEKALAILRSRATANLRERTEERGLPKGRNYPSIGTIKVIGKGFSIEVNTLERFLRRLLIIDDCIQLNVVANKSGYIQFHANKPNVYVHRFVWEFFIGKIPSGMTIDHCCKNRSCCNPGHLRLLSAGENCLDGTSPPAMNKIKTHCINGHAFDESNTIHYSYGRKCVKCRDITNLKWNTLRKMKRLSLSHPSIHQIAL